MVKKIILGVLLIISFKSLGVGSSTIIQDSQKATLDKYGYKVEIVDNIEDTENWGFNPAGLFVETEKTILLDSKYVDWSFNHEYGHFIDKINNYAAYKFAFDDIYNLEKEKYNFLNYDYARSSAVEYFASCYKIYIEKPNELKEVCPQTYNYIDNLENK